MRIAKKLYGSHKKGVKLLNWLDKYIMKHENGYLINRNGGLFVDVGLDYVRHVKGDREPFDLEYISKDSFLLKLTD